MARLFDDASNEYLAVSTPLISGYPFTMAAWVYIDATPGAGTADTFLSVGDIGSNDFFWDLRVEENLKAQMVKKGSAGGNIVIATSTSALSLNTWHHIAGYMPDDTNATIVLDGSSDSNSGNAGSPVGFTDQTAIGCLLLNAVYNPFSGRVAEAAIWDGIQLTLPEINALSARYSPLFIRPQSLTAYWPLIRDEDQDRVGGYNLTAFNTPSIAAHAPGIYRAQVYQSFSAAGAPPEGLSVPVAMHHYRQQGMV